MNRIALTFVLLLVVAPPAYSQVAVDFSATAGRGVTPNTVRLTGALVTPAPCCGPGQYTADFQWDPFNLVLVPVAIVTGPNGPFLPTLTGTYNLSLLTTQTCTNPSLNGTFFGSGLIRLTQQGDSVTGFAGVFFPAISAIDGVGIDLVVTPAGATGRLQLLTAQAALGTGTVTTTISEPLLTLSFAGGFPTLGCQFSGTGSAARLP